MNNREVCVVMPTYNNIGTLPMVIDSVLPYAECLIVVNDGSTDGTEDYLKAVVEKEPSRLVVISYARNRGKWFALSQGFARAIEMGYRYAITMDSDGQHFATDIPKFEELIRSHPDSLIVGQRQLVQENMPQKNTFANKFSNFWFRLQTLQNLPDTQAGFRLYPLNKIQQIKIITGRYEAELEILVRAAWRFIPILSLPIQVYYAPKGERVTHFRPFWDFLRISVLNIFLTLGALVYFYPKKLIKLILNR
ncbi:MAG: glycosyltransferase family 2 protein [Bacteroidales bacterium]|nr:glycosyltransferase family 2 protein [Bacteroidales bacterium]